MLFQQSFERDARFQNEVHKNEKYHRPMSSKHITQPSMFD